MSSKIFLYALLFPFAISAMRQAPVVSGLQIMLPIPSHHGSLYNITFMTEESSKKINETDINHEGEFIYTSSSNPNLKLDIIKNDGTRYALTDVFTQFTNATVPDLFVEQCSVVGNDNRSKHLIIRLTHQKDPQENDPQDKPDQFHVELNYKDTKDLAQAIRKMKESSNPESCKSSWSGMNSIGLTGLVAFIILCCVWRYHTR